MWKYILICSGPIIVIGFILCVFFWGTLSYPFRLTHYWLKIGKYFSCGLLFLGSIAWFLGIGMLLFHGENGYLESFVPASPIKFESSAWKNSTDWNDSTRGRMIDDLLASYTLRGMSALEIHKLLGEPEELLSSETQLIYWISPDGMRIDSFWLSLTLDENQKVKSYEIITD